MGNYSRILDVTLPAGRSAFLWGPRKTGKTTYLKEHFPQSPYFDFLRTDLFLELSREPFRLREILHARPASERKRPVILDEVQKVPLVLDEVQGMMEEEKTSFILCGSSARKLIRGKGNLLGGRAWRFELLPLTSAEIGHLDLLKALNNGLIPSHYAEEDARRSLDAYTHEYLKEEVFAEGLTRNIPAFARFFEALGYGHGELVNYANIARECGVDAKTVKEYYQILADTLLGRFVAPFKRRQDRQVITKAPKFYLFDVGVAGALKRRRLETARGEEFGRAFEHFIFMELKAHSVYSGLNYDIHFWRTKSGHEVDFILGRGEAAVEVKGASRVASPELRSIKAFTGEYKPRTSIVVCQERRKRLHEKILILPWRQFLEDLWTGKIIK